MNFSQQDLQQIKDKGLTEVQVKAQINTFKKGLPFISLADAAVLNSGIKSLNQKQSDHYITLYNSKKDDLDVLKFIPASGAATRMFKFLFNFLETYNQKKESLNGYINKQNATQLSVFLVGFEKLPFYEQVITHISKKIDFHSLDEELKVVMFIQTILDKNLLNFGAYPKGLLPFHKYKDHVATAFEEHLFEAALYASSNNECRLHFTISEKHKNKFTEEFKSIQNIVEEKTRTTFDITFSYQEEKTDTIAVTDQLNPIRDENNKLHFRPSGHGALLHNLNALDADLIFIKNIDNVVVSRNKKRIAKHKKELAGLLIEKQSKCFNYLNLIESKELKESEISEILNFLENELNVNHIKQFEKFSKSNKIKTIIEKLNRPIRVCGMVKNEGEPGGGPFWINENDESKSLQIVESAQINLQDSSQQSIVNKATHFNPVDMVCGIKNFKGETFNLQDYLNPSTGFITNKTRLGKVIKALELPGLWNGSMAYWNTIFVEVPLTTFNPVKTVNDLLKPSHQV